MNVDKKSVLRCSTRAVRDGVSFFSPAAATPLTCLTISRPNSPPPVTCTALHGDRLGDDVVAVLNALKLNKLVLAGHSFEGAELSSIANDHPDRVSQPRSPPPGGSDLASFNAVQKYSRRVPGFTFPEAELPERWTSTPDGRVGEERNPPGAPIFMALFDYREAIYKGSRALVIFANPQSRGTWVNNNTDPKVRQAKAFADAVPAAQVIQLPGAHYYVYLSNEDDVPGEMQAFLTVLGSDVTPPGPHKPQRRVAAPNDSMKARLTQGS